MVYDIESFIISLQLTIGHRHAQAARDVALEAVLLNSLSDPNIIKLRGVSFAEPGGFAHGPRGYFLNNRQARRDSGRSDQAVEWEEIEQSSRGGMASIRGSRVDARGGV